ncbi:hypothetical protein ACFPM7_06460 [Actinokineospora guangxiensis]|uniref:Nucleotidyltransferase-like protein n=1 Tax=Actinokineospora guangxiensis TaxID=1490288 RepID=A0ABW0EH39_9PSEU
MGIEFVRLPEVDSADVIEHGRGPWASVADGGLMGRGGPQPEDGDIDIALLLRRRAWGWGQLIHREMLHRVFGAIAPESVTALLPTTRRSAHALLRLGYAPDGAAEIGGHPRRYRLRPPKKLSSLKRGCRATGRVVGVPRVGNR